MTDEELAIAKGSKVVWASSTLSLAKFYGLEPMEVHDVRPSQCNGKQVAILGRDGKIIPCVGADNRAWMASMPLEAFAEHLEPHKQES